MTGFDTTRPNIARVYDYWLGGKDNFAVDRELARTMTEVNAGIPAMARANRDFIAAAVRKVAEAGVEQFLDLGAGLPTSPAVHEAARAVNPDARVVYVDSDPVVVSHASALLATKPGIYALEGDLTEPDQVLAHPVVQEAIDWARPACVILAAVLHFADAVTAGRLIAAYADAACAGSWLAVSVFAGREETMEARSRSTYTAAEFWVHGTDDMARWLDGLDVIPPGICEARRWMSGGAASRTVAGGPCALWLSSRSALRRSPRGQPRTSGCLRVSRGARRGRCTPRFVMPIPSTMSRTATTGCCHGMPMCRRRCSTPPGIPPRAG